MYLIIIFILKFCICNFSITKNTVRACGVSYMFYFHIIFLYPLVIALTHTSAIYPARFVAFHGIRLCRVSILDSILFLSFYSVSVPKICWQYSSSGCSAHSHRATLSACIRSCPPACSTSCITPHLVQVYPSSCSIVYPKSLK